MQLSLLDQPSLAPAPLARWSPSGGGDSEFAGARRLDLGLGAWVELVPGWLAGHRDLYHRLLATADWERHHRQMYDRIVEVPRLIAALPGSGHLAYPQGHEQPDSVIRHRAPSREVRAVGDQLRRIAVVLSHRYQRTLTDVTLAHYRDGQDSVAYHGDKLGPLRRDAVVAVLSVGERRRFLLRPAKGAGPEPSSSAATRRALAFDVGEGDLLVMGGTCQDTFEHAVPKARKAGPRIAIMFREVLRVPASSAGSLAGRAKLSAESGAHGREGFGGHPRTVRYSP